MNELPLLGKLALITGASRGIGRASAVALAEAGCDVIINYVTSESGAVETAEQVLQLGRQAIVIKGDVSEPEDIQQMFRTLETRYPALDILISNAASGGFRNVMDATAKHFDAAMHTNVRSLMLLTQKAMPMMEKAPGMKKIVAISSHGSYRALPAYGLIGASKAAIESLIRHLAMELGVKGFNCNCVLAGLVATDSTKHVPNADEMFKLMDEKLFMPPGSRLQAVDVARAVRYLCSPESDFVQGATLTIDGGAALGV